MCTSSIKYSDFTQWLSHNGSSTDDLRCLVLSFLYKRNLHLCLRLLWLSNMVVKAWFVWLLKLRCLALNFRNECNLHLSLRLQWLSIIVVTEWFVWLSKLHCLALNFRTEYKNSFKPSPLVVINVLLIGLMKKQIGSHIKK